VAALHGSDRAGQRGRAHLADEAAIVAVRGNREVLTASDFDAARDRIILGRREGSNVLLPEEKHAVAVHESGHALVAALSEHADPVAKVTILPTGQTLGGYRTTAAGRTAHVRRELPA
jgi:cell division protease FtsH